MSFGTRTKRLIYLTHRWTGVATSVLMALWFVSGMVMLFVGYPKFTPWERLGALPVLSTESCCVALSVALSHSQPPAAVQEIVLTSIRNHPHYRLREDTGSYVMVDAVTGKLAHLIDRQSALAGARAFLPDADAEYIEQIHEDRWTHSRSLDPHRPLHKVQMYDSAHTLVYLSSATGQVVMDAPRVQQLWGYVGAWLHWLYIFRDRPVDPVWSWIVIILSAIGTLTAGTGALIGIWRWRFSGRYKTGSRSPYREPYLRWHHITGLVFASIIFCWIFSGLMSMNPLGIFDAKGERPNLSAYRNGNPAAIRLTLEAPQILTLLKEADFQPSEIEWRVIGGRPYLLTRDAQNNTRLIVQNDGKIEVHEQWADAELLTAASHLLSASIISHQRLEHYDAYYYRRQTEAMMGTAERRLPALHIRFDDPHSTWVYLDPYTGDMELGIDSSKRAGRWLFNFLHSWDLPFMLQSGMLRDAILILLSLGGLVLSGIGVIIGSRRIQIWSTKLRR